MPILLSDVIKELNISIEQAENCLFEGTDMVDVTSGKDYELTDEQYDVLKTVWRKGDSRRPNCSVYYKINSQRWYYSCSFRTKGRHYL